MEQNINPSAQNGVSAKTGCLGYQTLQEAGGKVLRWVYENSTKTVSLEKKRSLLLFIEN